MRITLLHTIAFALMLALAGCTATTALRVEDGVLLSVDAALTAYETLDAATQQGCIDDAATLAASRACRATWKERRKPAVVVADAIKAALVGKQAVSSLAPLAAQLAQLVASLRTPAPPSPGGQ